MFKAGVANYVLLASCMNKYPDPTGHIVNHPCLKITRGTYASYFHSPL